MVVSRGRNPSAAEILSQVFQSKGLRDRVLTTLGLLLLVRLGIYVPVPGIDRVAFQGFLQQGGQLLGFLDIFEWLTSMQPSMAQPISCWLLNCFVRRQADPAQLAHTILKVGAVACVAELPHTCLQVVSLVD